MDKIAALLLHPSPEVRASLRERLGGVDFIKVLGETVTAFEASELLKAIPYGLIFLGVDLPGGVSGIELAQTFCGKKYRPALVFIAPDESLAYKAFELGAADYLIWPFTEERFAGAIDRLNRYRPAFKEIPPPGAINSPGQASDGDDDDEETVRLPMEEEEEDRFISALKQAWDLSKLARPMEIEKLPITQDGRTILLPYTHVIFIEAYEDYSFVHTSTQKFLTSYRLKALEDRLKPHRFFRVHRKYLVNLDLVTEIASLPGGNFMLRTAGKTRIELPIGRRRIGELKQLLGL